MMSKVDDAIIPPVPNDWDRCHAYNETKRRYCRQVPVPLCINSTTCSQPRYCGNHMHLLDDGDCMERNDNSAVVDAVKSKRPRGGLTTDRVGRRIAFRGKRVPCPIDSSHFIFEGDIPKHVLICPKVKCQQELAGKEYYCKGINLGGFGEMERRVGDLASPDDDRKNDSSSSELDEVKKLAYAVLRVFHHLFLAKNDGKSNATLSINQLQNITESEIYNALTESDLSVMEEKIDSVTTSNLSAAEVQSKETSVRPGRLTTTIAKHNINAGGSRHLRQIASILGHVRCKGLISTKTEEDDKTRNVNPLIIEVGAGRGMTGLIVAGAMAASLDITNSSSRVNLCLVEKSGTRRKAERKTRSANGYSAEDCLRLDMVDIKRVKADLSDIDMPKALQSQLGSLEFSKTVVIAKHLCGAGTDLAIMSMRNLDSVDGCVMATCCHGLCSWNEYVGRNCLLELFHEKVGGLTTFGDDQFNVLKRWSSAAVSVERKSALEEYPTKGDDDNNMKETHYVDKADDGKGQNIFALSIELGLSCGGAGLGRACQRIIDYGRCDYLKGRGFKVDLFHYVPPDVTPQNALIVATKI
jgi:tRNA:m4X modification enzyme